MKKVVAIIQARMGSTRLLGKVMLKLCGKTVLAHDIERIKQSSLIDEIVIATTILEDDDIIEKEALKNGVKVYRGSEKNVLSRYYEAAKENNADIIIRITSDCPLIDPVIINNMIEFYLKNEYEVVTNVGAGIEYRTYPRGLDVEIFSFENLNEAHAYAKEDYEKEHVTPYIYDNSKKIYYFQNSINYSKYRWTVDTEEDFILIEEIYKELYKGKHDFYFEDILKLFYKKPELFEINKYVEQKRINK